MSLCSSRCQCTSLRTQQSVQLCNQVQSHIWSPIKVHTNSRARLIWYLLCSGGYKKKGCMCSAVSGVLIIWPNAVGLFISAQPQSHLALVTRVVWLLQRKKEIVRHRQWNGPSLFISRGKWPESPAGGSVLWFTQHDDDFLDISLVSGLSKRADSTKKNKFGHRCSSFHFTICMCH